MGLCQSIEAYLAHVGQQRNSSFGRRFRSQFRDTRGTAELAMLAAPSEDEFAQFQRAVAVMTEKQKAQPETLSDDEIRDIAQMARAEAGNISIFINGFVLERKKTQ